MDKVLYILAGPTASGKTQWALEWAQKEQAEIISCDSLLVYKQMDIGTAKPTKKEQSLVRHYLIDCVEVGHTFSVKEYIEASRKAIEAILNNGKKILIVGGSGFYLKSFLAPVIDSVEDCPAIRQQVNSWYSVDGLDALVDRLGRLNPDGLGNLDIRNPIRVMRALERCLATGKDLKTLREAFEKQPIHYADFLKKIFFIDHDNEILKKRIFERVQAMFEQGLIHEVEHLLKIGIRNNPSAARAIGYREVIAWMDNGQLESIDSLINTIVQNTQQLVRKQRIWFRNQLSGYDLEWVNTL